MTDEPAQDLLRHYLEVREAERLLAGPGQLERVRTLELIERYLQKPPAKILDVGGGPGIYAAWLAARGYEVDLIDPVPSHVEEAQQLFAIRGVPGEAHIGDARSLDSRDESCDVVLLLGPLYHLTDHSDRIRALGEARRVIRPSGLIFVAAISRFAALLDGFSRNLIRDPEFVSILDRDLRDGQHRNPTGNPAYFTTAFFHKPDELIEEIREARLEVETLVGVEGPFWCMANFDEIWGAEQSQQLLLDMLRRVETESSLLGASAHWLAVARRP